MKWPVWILYLSLLAALPGVARADVELLISQDVSALFGASSPPGPFYLGFNLNSGDGGVFNNTVSIYDFGLTTGVALVGGPTVVQGNATGTLAPGDQLDLSEGGVLPGDVTTVLQEFMVTSATAKLTFTVGATQNYAGAMSFAPDMFTYQLLYDDDGMSGTPPVAVFTTLSPGNIDFVQYELKPDNYTAPSGGVFPGANPSPLDALGAAAVNVVPEPGSLLVWGAVFAGCAAVRARRRKAAMASAHQPDA